MARKRGRFLVGVVAALAVLSVSVTPASGAVCLQRAPEIMDTLASNIVWDHGPGPLVRQSKFVIVFAAPEGPCPQDIESAVAAGPGGYRLDFKPHQRLDIHNLNGHIDDRYMHTVWLMAFDKSGFLPDGQYTLTVRFKNGVVRRRVDHVRFGEKQRALLDSYERSRSRIRFSPTGEAGSPALSTTLRWSTLRRLGGPSAYYSSRVSEPLDGFIDPHRMTWWDAVFYQSRLLPEAGRDLASQPLPPGLLRAGRRYAWFVEILDSNKFEELDLAIFQPAQFFVAR